MPVTDPKAGRVFIWGISSFLFLSIAAGGACLALYMLMPETPTLSWLPIAGVTLVCLPWLFWLFTFLYRIFSRVFGFRLGVNCGGGTENSNNEPSTAVVAAEDHESPAGNNNGERRVQFEAAVTVHENDGDGDSDHGGDWQGMDDQDRNKHRTLSSSSSSSFMSHESEMPLASSMAS